jgi:hypothetical protein
MSLLVTSASGTNGAGYGAILGFGDDGNLLGPFSSDPRIVDPRGLALERSSGGLIYVNSGSDRVLALNERGHVIRDSGRLSGLDPGGANFGSDGRFYLTARRRQTILSMPPSLDGRAEPVLPDHVVTLPRGFAFARDGRLFLASGIGPSGEGDDTIVAFDRRGAPQAARLVADPELSPLDMALAENGHLVVASEHPFGAPDAVATIREYDPSSGGLVRVFVPDRSLNFGKPRGLRFGPDGRLYCVGQDHVIAFDFPRGDFLGPVVELPRLNGQALVLLAKPAAPSDGQTPSGEATAAA